MPGCMQVYVALCDGSTSSHTLKNATVKNVLIILPNLRLNLKKCTHKQSSKKTLKSLFILIKKPFEHFWQELTN